jgi:hypothetical protein
MTGRWILHRDLGPGEVLDQDGRRATARFKAGVRSVEGKFRPVAADSLPVLLAIDPDGTRALVLADPVAIAYKLLRDSPSPQNREQLLAQARSSGLAAAEVDAWWEAAGPLLADAGDIVVEGEPPSYRVREEPTPVEDAPAAPPQQPAEQESVESVETADPPALVRLVFDATSPEIARVAAKRLGETLSDGALAEVLDDRIRPVVTALAQDRDPATATALSAMFRRTRPVVTERCPPSVVRLLLEADAVISELPKDVAGRAPAALRQLLESAKVDVAAFEAAIAPLDDTVLTGRLRHLPLAPKGGRIAFLDALASAGRDAPLVDESSWVGVDAAALGSVFGTPAVSRLVANPVGRAVAASIVRRVLKPLRSAGLSTLSAAPPLLGLLSDDEISAALVGLCKADAHIGRLRDLMAEPQIAEVRMETRVAIAEADERVAAAERRAEAASLTAQEQVNDARRREREARDLVRDAADAASTPYRAELRQARVDALRDVVEVLAEALRLAGPAAHPEVFAAARQRGLHPMGEVGEETTFDRARHNSLIEITDGIGIVVVEPGWSTEFDGTELVLTKALVRPVH